MIAVHLIFPSRASMGTAIGVDGNLWLRLDNGLYVRASVTADIDCGLIL